MEKARKTDEINNAADLEGAQANSHVQRMINREGVNVEQAGATFMECWRNYVASIGGYIIDGCEKFVKGVGGQDETKEAFLCARCGCHRSFHRKVLSPPPHVRDTRYYNIMNYLRSLPLTVLSPRPPTPWLMRSPTVLPNNELIEGQGSSMSPREAEEKSESEKGEEVNQPSKINKAG
ncbi:hypothetical protein REPUB_Repub04eG0015400 [Reevesia pubescens]